MTVYEKTIKEMTPEKFAVVSVKPAVLNGTEMFYVTSSGQLFPFNQEGLQSAVNYQYQLLMQESNEGVTNSDTPAKEEKVRVSEKNNKIKTE